MSGFQKTDKSGILVHVGEPDCNAAHAALLAALNAMGTAFIGPTDQLTLSQKGNLGEFVSLHIGRHDAFAGHQGFASNAIQPLTKISGAGVDLMFVYFDPIYEENDLLYIQETKTTSQENLNYFSALEADYEKLFSTDLNLTLQSRISYLSNSFEMERNNDDYARRVQRLGGTSPSQCTRTRLIPTGIHKLGIGNPVQKMLAVKTAIAGFGWVQSSISPWAIGLSDLEDRLLRLARGQS